MWKMEIVDKWIMWKIEIRIRCIEHCLKIERKLSKLNLFSVKQLYFNHITTNGFVFTSPMRTAISST